MPGLRRSEDAAADREALRRLLKEKGILRAGPGQPIRGRDGTRAPWMFYSWNCSLTSEGSALAGRCLLDRLQSFRGKQLACYGYTGVPLMAACILLSEGKYTGLAIREARKEHGSLRQIEGPADRRYPVVIIDDSLSSGTSLRRAIQALEAEGFQVEGALALVNFPFRGGMEWASALGYRVEAIFDAWEDLAAPRPSVIPGYRRLASELWAEERVPDALHPAIAARHVAEFYLNYGRMARPPTRFDRSYDGRGGVYVSFRERHSDHRLARDGFWHFEPEDSDPCRDLVLATVKTLRASAGAVSLHNLADLKIAVSFFGPLEKISPAKLDFARYGIVARSLGPEPKMGGALPNTQVFTSEVEQYMHARWRNARISAFEPHDLYRHEIAKCVEPGEYWLPYGIFQDPASHWGEDRSIGITLTERALAAVRAAADGVAPSGDPVPDGLIPAPVYAVAVTLYWQGVKGCYVTWGGPLDACLVRAATRALTDNRFAERTAPPSIEDLAIAVSVLHDREWLGEVTLEQAARKLRLGADSLAVQQGERRAFLLSAAAPHYDLTKEQFAKELLRKAGIGQPPYSWSTFQTTTWLRTVEDTHKVVSGFPERPPVHRPEERWASEIDLLAGYIERSLDADGLPEYCRWPVTGRRARRGSAARLVHALAALEEASGFTPMPARREAALYGLRHCLDNVVVQNEKASLRLPGQQASAMADCQLLAAAAVCDLPQSATSAIAALAARVAAMFQPDGRITDTPHGLGVASEHDFLPGVAVLALARYAARRADAAWAAGLSPQLNWYRRRFRLMHPWGMVGWQTQAWAAVHELTGDPEHARFVFEIADWALDWQLENSGAFVTDLSPSGPSFHTAFLTEGIAAAWRLANRCGEERRAGRYARACREALRFLSRLIIYPEDTFCMRDPARAIGGVRGSLATSAVRIDFVSHTLVALTRSLSEMRREQEPASNAA